MSGGDKLRLFSLIEFKDFLEIFLFFDENELVSIKKLLELEEIYNTDEFNLFYKKLEYFNLNNFLKTSEICKKIYNDREIFETFLSNLSPNLFKN